MTALVDDAFRVISAASQGDDARVLDLLARMTLDDVFAFAELIRRLRVPIAAELADRGLRIVREQG